MLPATILRSPDSRDNFELYRAILDQIKPIRCLALMKDDRAFLKMNPACTARKNLMCRAFIPLRKELRRCRLLTRADSCPLI